MNIKTLFSTKRSNELLQLVQTGQPLSLQQQVLLVVLLSIPAMLAQLSNIVMEYIDASMVGSLGANASASIGLVSTSTWLIWGLCSSMTAGFNVIVAHRVGARDFAGARSVVRQGLLFMLCYSCVVAVSGAVVAEWLPSWLGGEEEIQSDATAYFRLISSFLPITQCVMLSTGVLRSSGNVMVPSLLNVMMCFLDIVFNYLFIFPFHTISFFGAEVTVPGAGLGVRGAAIGTMCAEIITFVCLFYYLCRRSPILALRLDNNKLRAFVPRRALLSEALHISLPMLFQHITMTSAQVVSTTIVAPLGKMSIAANSFGINAESLCYMPGYGIGDATQTIVGQSIGAKRQELTKNFAHVGVVLGMGVMTIMGVIMYLAAPLMMGLLTPVAEIQELGVSALRIEAFAEPMFAASIVCYSVFVGAGDTAKPFVMNLVSMWGVRLTLATWLAPKYGLDGVWTAMCIELCFRGVIFLLRMRFGRWLPGSKKRE